ncbi:GntR family transcriptional regulator [Corynebacterium gottingense]|uniref:GntR family transcriptional regulator n=1 Tax=Corynebacterium gottingense TaxID=2041036 RepID=A0ABX9UKZ1_9CORY|nr:GntR family transcriptional regulator [Corynebacterium gottingense]RMD20126.1 GntR family transcriptional regulator [Corynebacterium gottingense]WJZ13771.1 HTH-type transcriptional repressor YvoA [Corynebacterium gottingense]WJZ16086.1 HTH-type transcriptional repressor YvoA [Corynebacterium gottingense]
MATKPAYLRIAETLRTRIESHELKPGDKLPPERELVDQFNVARMTVRHALDVLQLEGIIERKRGRAGGTFVRALPPVVDLNGATGLAAQLEEKGVDIVSKLLFSGRITPPRVVAAAFGDTETDAELGDGASDKVYAEERVHYADGAPAFSETLYVRPGYEEGYAVSSLTLTVDRRPEAATLREDVVTPGAATDVERGRLQMAANAPLQRVTRKLYEGGLVVAYATIVVRPDVAQLRTVTRF